MYRGREVAIRVSLYPVLANALTLMLACIAMSTLVITSVSAQTRDKAIVVTGPGDAAQSTESTQGKCWALLVGCYYLPVTMAFHHLRHPPPWQSGSAEM